MSSEAVTHGHLDADGVENCADLPVTQSVRCCFVIGHMRCCLTQATKMLASSRPKRLTLKIFEYSRAPTKRELTPQSAHVMAARAGPLVWFGGSTAGMGIVSMFGCERAATTGVRLRSALSEEARS